MVRLLIKQAARPPTLTDAIAANPVAPDPWWPQSG
jgi:hypothetical protein